MASDPKFSDLKEAQQVARWHDRISVSQRRRDQVAEENNWERYLDELKNKYDVVLGNIQVPPIGEMFAYKDTTLSNLYYSNPYVTVNAKKNATIESAYILEAGVNHLWKELKLKEDLELQITDALFVGHAWNKVGINVKTSGSGDQLKIVEDSIYANRVSWRDMLFNVGAKNPPKDCFWVAQTIYRPTEDVKKDYGRAASKITGSSYPSIDVKYLKNVLYKEDFNYTVLREIWDARERKIFLIADGLMDHYLEDPKPWPSYLEEFPYQFLAFHEIPDEPFPQSDVSPWEPQVKEKIKIFTMMLNFAKRWNRQLLMKKNIMSPQEVDKFEKGMEGSVLQAAISGNVDIQSAFKMLDWGSMPPDFYMILDRIDAIIRTTRGQAEIEQGGTTRGSTRTEGELQMIERGGQTRAGRKQDRIERHCENIARHLVIQMKNNFDVPYIARITGKEPPEIINAFKQQGIYDPSSKTIRFTMEDVKGEFDVGIKIGSTLPLDIGTRDKILDSVMQTGAQLASVPSIPPFLAEVIKERLRDYDIKGLEVAFDQQQAQLSQKTQGDAITQESQIAKTESETAKRKAQAKQIDADTIIKTANAMGKVSGDIHPDVSLQK
jgi:hypothetical protein